MGKSITPEEVIKEIKEKPWKWHNQLWWFLRHGFWQRLSDIPLHTKSFFQRGWRGWSPMDIWDFFGYLSTVIREGLIHLKKYQHGHPGDLKEEEWDKILDEIIKAFSLAEKISMGDREAYMPRLSGEDQKKYNCLTKEEDKLMRHGMHLFAIHFFALWD